MAIPSGINTSCSPEKPSPNPVEDDGMLIENGQVIFDVVDKSDEIKAKPGMTIRESFESNVSQQLNWCRDDSGRRASRAPISREIHGTDD